MSDPCVKIQPQLGCYVDDLGVSQEVVIHYAYDGNRALGQVVTGIDSTVPIDTSTGTLTVGACGTCCPVVTKEPICFLVGSTRYEGWEMEIINPQDGSTINRYAVDRDRTISEQVFEIVSCCGIDPEDISVQKILISPDFTPTVLPVGIIEAGRVAPNNFTLRVLDPVTGLVLQNLGTITDADVNGIGWSNANGRIYMIDRINDVLSYWDVDLATQVFVANITMPPGNFNFGDFDDVTQTFYLSGGGQQIYSVDVNTGVMTLIPTSPLTPAGAGDLSFDENGGVWVKSGFTLTHYPDPFTNVPDNVLTLDVNGDTDGGGSLAYKEGELFGAYSTNGLLWTIDIATGVTTTVVNDVPLLSFDMTSVRLNPPFSVDVVVTWEVEVCNNSNEDMTNVVVNDPAIETIVFDANGIETGGIVPAGTCATLRYSYQLKQADIDSGQYSNTAVVTGDNFQDMTTNTITVSAEEDGGG